ncbi:hypothetical protein HY494_01325 [Candidatus Woesearchaeota archaeon]|nr:hypothetical protein [Candidatus Woesearchaeota archaeon]
MATESKLVMGQLKSIKEELDYIKEHMVDRDMFLDVEEMKLLQESYEHEKQGELVSQEELEKELGL